MLLNSRAFARSSIFIRDKKQCCRSYSVSQQTALSTDTDGLLVDSVHEGYSRDIKEREESNISSKLSSTVV